MIGNLPKSDLAGGSESHLREAGISATRPHPRHPALTPSARTVGGMTACLPLQSLLLDVLRELERAYTDEGAGSFHIPSLDLWANFVRKFN